MFVSFDRFWGAAALLLCLAGGPALADEIEVRTKMNAFVGMPVVDSVIRVPQGGLYEVVLNTGELIYTDEEVSFIIDGRIIDTKTRENLTALRLQQISAIDFASLPLDQAMKRVAGNGKRVIVTFEDPNCGFCKKLARELMKIQDVTVYTFLYPILSEDSTIKSRNIWCAKDRAKAWNDWVISATVPTTAKCDSRVIDRNLVLGEKLRIHSTPTLFFADGSRIGGYRDAAGLERALAAIADGKPGENPDGKTDGNPNGNPTDGNPNGNPTDGNPSGKTDGSPDGK
jgi:thiol:disulfide interchange protein DsbC